MNRPTEPSSRVPADITVRSDALDWIAATGRTERLLDVVESGVRRRRRRRRVIGSAAVALALFIVVGLSVRPFNDDIPKVAVLAQTATVETRVLSDGSSVELAPGAAIRVEFEANVRR